MFMFFDNTRRPVKRDKSFQLRIIYPYDSYGLCLANGLPVVALLVLRSNIPVGNIEAK